MALAFSHGSRAKRSRAQLSMTMLQSNNTRATTISKSAKVAKMDNTEFLGKLDSFDHKTWLTYQVADYEGRNGLVPEKQVPVTISEEGTDINAKPIKLTTNFFEIFHTNCSVIPLHQHRVKYDKRFRHLITVDTPFLLTTDDKEHIGVYKHDKPYLYSVKQLADGDGKKSYLETKLPTSLDGVATLPIRIVWEQEIKFGEELYDKFWRNVLHRLLTSNDMSLININGQYFEPQPIISITSEVMQDQHIYLCKGYKPVIKYHTGSKMFLHVDPVYGLFSSANVLQIINKIYNDSAQAKESGATAVARALVGHTMFTKYDRRATYVITGIDWMSTPDSIYEWEKDGKNMRDGAAVYTYLEYYKNVWGLDLQDLNQPLIIAARIKQPIEGINTNRHIPLVRLAPELCYLVGLTNEMRGEQAVVQMEAQDKKHHAKTKMAYIKELRRRVGMSSKIKTLWSQGIEISDKMVTCTGRQLPKEKLVFRFDHESYATGLPDDNNEWPGLLENRQVVSQAQIAKWAILYPNEINLQQVKAIFDPMKYAAKSLGMKFKQAFVAVKIKPTLGSYKTGIENLFTKHPECQFMMIILPASGGQKLDQELAKYLATKYGVACNFCSTDDFASPEQMNNLTRNLLIQMNAKLGGEPWRLLLPKDEYLKDLMVVGTDIMSVIRDPPDARHPIIVNSCVVGATVASTNSDFTKYYNCMFKYDKNGEVGNLLKVQMQKCLDAYQLKNDGKLPRRIVCYRGSVGDDELEDVREIELDQIKALLTAKYLAASLQPPELTYIVINQKTVTRLFTTTGDGKMENAPPGTVVDEYITTTEQQDFYLIAQGAKPPDNATLPVHYNVVHNTSGLDLDALERLTYKFCHLDYSQMGTAAIPAPCHYAQKLIELDLKLGLGRKEFFSDKLGHTLHFL